ncbi:hypothetical protein [Phenylobacterium sp.]|uniref:terminase small subunit-like protein n=1 Tax=Phenylobacterium sp. TaxID=1871053 RepID=UPI0025F6F746|nr:hypothetical protein [Phenylobacterium sp.]
MRPAYPLAQMQTLVIERMEAGFTLDRIAELPGYPCRQTLHWWGKADPGFVVRMARARAYGRGQRSWAQAGPSFNHERVGAPQRARDGCRCTPALTAAICDAIRQGASLRSLSMTPGMPHHGTMYCWVRRRPDFAAAVAQACVDREDRYLDQALEIAERCAPQTLAAAQAQVGALRRKMRLMRPYPGSRRAKRMA